MSKIFSSGKGAKNAYATKIRTPVIKSKVASHVLKENPTAQITISKSLNIFVGTVNKIIKYDLKLIKTNKPKKWCSSSNVETYFSAYVQIVVPKLFDNWKLEIYR